MEIIEDVQKGCFSAVMLAIGRLVGEKEIVKGEVEIELVEDNLLKELGEEREFGNRVLVFLGGVIWVKILFLRRE